MDTDDGRFSREEHMKQPKDSSPGPWFVTAGIVPDASGRLIVQDRDEQPVCATSARGVQGRTEAMAANANLIASAPDMFSALIAALEWIEDDRSDDEYINEEWYHAAVAAIRMAGHQWPRKTEFFAGLVCHEQSCTRTGCPVRRTRKTVEAQPVAQLSLLPAVSRAAGPQAPT